MNVKQFVPLCCIIHSPLSAVWLWEVLLLHRQEGSLLEALSFIIEVQQEEKIMSVHVILLLLLLVCPCPYEFHHVNPNPIAMTYG